MQWLVLTPWETRSLEDGDVSALNLRSLLAIRVFYFIADSYPAWRSDLAELFCRELPRRGIETTWSMRRADRGGISIAEQHGQSVFLPLALGRERTTTRLLNRPLEMLSEALLFLRLVFGRRYDVIQVRDDRYLAGCWAWLAARLTGAKFVYWLSFPFPENDALSASRTAGVKRWILTARSVVAGAWLYRFIMRRADHLFVQSAEMRKDLVALGLDAAKMTPVPMGAPDRLLEWHRRNSVTVQRNLVAYVGTLAEARHLETIIDAFLLVHAERPDAELLMVGDGDAPHERKQLEVHAASLGLSQVVRFTGFVPMVEAWAYSASAQVCLSPIYPSRVLNVGSPTKIVESLALSRPVVANHHPEQSDVLQQSGGGICVEWSAEEYAKAVLSLLSDTEVADRMGRSGAHWVAENRTYSRIAELVAQSYARLLKADA